MSTRSKLLVSSTHRRAGGDRLEWLHRAHQAPLREARPGLLVGDVQSRAEGGVVVVRGRGDLDVTTHQTAVEHVKAALVRVLAVSPMLCGTERGRKGERALHHSVCVCVCGSE